MSPNLGFSHVDQVLGSRPLVREGKAIIRPETSYEIDFLFVILIKSHMY
jgi:hypothetical protein